MKLFQIILPLCIILVIGTWDSTLVSANPTSVIQPNSVPVESNQVEQHWIKPI